jgi:Putative porin
MSTTENGNPRGANQTLDNEFSRKSLDLDFAYFDWKMFGDVHVIGGKMKTPFFRPGQSLFYDNDVNPEGLAFTYTNGMWFGTAYGYWIDENVPVTNTTPTDADTMMFGGQFGLKLPVGASSLSLAAMYYDLAAAKGRRPFFNGSSNGNTTIGVGTAAVLANDFRVASLSAEFNAKLGKLPFQLWADVAQNQAAELDTAYMVGAMFGKAADARSWEAGFAYQVLEKDALFAQHIDSDFAGGVSDAAGWVFRAGYAPLKNWSINAAYFMARRNMDVGQEADYDRLLLDFNVKY